ncbi:MAG: hypothetical protein KatS3mg003_0030 [Candidatus Nitrosocaldaceae archaeon]|nr:MAG: hypothetical protein KatS3mg003_0030 [Candidatus Nitrosocaldaceae archaeon]
MTIFSANVILTPLFIIYYPSTPVNNPSEIVSINYSNKEVKMCILYNRG